MIVHSRKECAAATFTYVRESTAPGDIVFSRAEKSDDSALSPSAGDPLQTGGLALPRPR